MFDRFVRFAQARRALQGGHFEQALRLIDDPSLQSDGKSAEIRRRALDGLEERARRRIEQGGYAAATADLERLLEVDPTRAAALRLQVEIEGLLAGRSDDRRVAAKADRAERLAAQDDPAAARRELSDAGATPAVLRTRIFDLKRRIAAAEGLDEAFVLRVDEGGEFLVVRGESLTLGNLRDGSADLPILASLAGQHARLRRSMSFHGGLVDSIEAERGELWNGRERVERHRFGHGDRLRLGPNLELGYQQPSDRSLTARLTIFGGFQIAGTDQLLWMKDRGRDGRILLGPGPDSHVQVPSASQEVELFADRDGRIRVHCVGGGRIDGEAFSGDQPVTAGVEVCCGGLSFVLQPWGRD